MKTLGSAAAKIKYWLHINAVTDFFLNFSGNIFTVNKMGEEAGADVYLFDVSLSLIN